MKTRKVSVSLLQIIIAASIIIALIIISIRVIKNLNSNDQKAGIANMVYGEGNAENQYKIEKIEDLIVFSQNVNSGNTFKGSIFKLINKLDFQDDSSYNNPQDTSFGDLNNDGKIEDIKTELTTGTGFAPIGNDSSKNYFEGTFDGNDKTISNLVTSSENTYVGLFGYNKGTISSLKVSGAITIEKELKNNELYIAMIAGENDGTIYSCKTEGSITVNISNNSSEITVAGIVGKNTGNITDSSNSIIITSNQTKAGITAVNNGNIINCTNTGEIKEESITNTYTAGIVAKNQGGTITSCTNTGTIQGKIAGGIAGYSNGNIISSQNSGNISNIKIQSTNDEKLGGIAAEQDIATIENCKNTGNISGISQIGGIVGENRGIISQSTNNGTIQNLSDTNPDKSSIGGIAGISFENSKIINSKNLGNITVTSSTSIDLGGICGNLNKTALIDTCENGGTIQGEGKEVVPNGDLTTECVNCKNTGGGSVNQSESGEIFVGVIYGKVE